MYFPTLSHLPNSWNLPKIRKIQKSPKKFTPNQRKKKTIEFFFFFFKSNKFSIHVFPKNNQLHKFDQPNNRYFPSNQTTFLYPFIIFPANKTIPHITPFSATKLHDNSTEMRGFKPSAPSSSSSSSHRCRWHRGGGWAWSHESRKVSRFGKRRSRQVLESQTWSNAWRITKSYMLRA